MRLIKGLHDLSPIHTHTNPALAVWLAVNSETRRISRHSHRQVEEQRIRLQGQFSPQQADREADRHSHTQRHTQTGRSSRSRWPSSVWASSRRRTTSGRVTEDPQSTWRRITSKSVAANGSKEKSDQRFVHLYAAGNTFKMSCTGRPALLRARGTSFLIKYTASCT